MIFEIIRVRMGCVLCVGDEVGGGFKPTLTHTLDPQPTTHPHNPQLRMFLVVMFEAVVMEVSVHLVLVAVLVDMDEIIRFKKLCVS